MGSTTNLQPVRRARAPPYSLRLQDFEMRPSGFCIRVVLLSEVRAIRPPAEEGKPLTFPSRRMGLIRFRRC
jgi:hypothetical protein